MIAGKPQRDATLAFLTAVAVAAVFADAAGRGAPEEGARTVAAEQPAAGPAIATTGDAQAVAAKPTSTGRAVATTGGAAPGYVDDAVCGGCHQDLAESYRAVGMARSFYPPSAAEWIEDFDAAPYFHAPSERYYALRRAGDGLRFRRHQLDADGAEINVLELDVDWIVGSGNRSRVYLFRTPGGELFQLPLAWYTQDAIWAMAPGFDNPDHSGVGRRVQRECLFCHNAYPDQPAGSDRHDEPHRFPAELPHGIGCQRCHGPGGEHVRLGRGEAIDFEALAASITNPAELSPERRREVCYQCHMQPSVALTGVRRFGRGVYSYRPGEPLDDYLVQIDVVEADHEAGERFEINHHPYRLEQSVCFQKSAGALSCLTCHDPHRKVPAETRVAHYRAACLHCHELDDCALEAMTAAGDPGAGHPASGGDPGAGQPGAGQPRAGQPRAGDPWAGRPATHAPAAGGDCAGCHMPRRRAQDVVHAVMTDHRIVRRHDGEALVAPLAETTPVIVDARVLDAGGSLDAETAAVYRALTVLRASGAPTAGAWLARNLPRILPSEPEPYHDLVRWQLQQRRGREAETTLRRLLAQRPEDPGLTALLAAAHVRMGELDRALELAAAAVELDPERPEARYNLGRLLLGLRGPEPAIPHLQRAVALRPVFDAAWYQLGVALERADRRDEAEDALRRALAVAPENARAYVTLGRLLAAQGRREEALRYLRHGTRVADDRQAVAAELARAQAAGAGR